MHRVPSRSARCIGLLGGSFNPAHDGHRHISVEALKRLHLDEVWWLVSPQNPLKQPRGMAPLAVRLERARRVAAHPRIRVTDLESRLGTRYTVDTIRDLQRRLPRVRFVWLMGADNLEQIVAWKDWREIFERVPVAVFARPTYSLRALAGTAASRYGHRRVSERKAEELARRVPPVWVFLPIRLSPCSATAIRAASKEG